MSQEKDRVLVIEETYLRNYLKKKYPLNQVMMISKLRAEDQPLSGVAQKAHGVIKKKKIDGTE